MTSEAADGSRPGVDGGGGVVGAELCDEWCWVACPHGRSISQIGRSRWEGAIRDAVVGDAAIREDVGDRGTSAGTAPSGVITSPADPPLRAIPLPAPAEPDDTYSYDAHGVRFNTHGVTSTVTGYPDDTVSLAADTCGTHHISTPCADWPVGERQRRHDDDDDRLGVYPSVRVQRAVQLAKSAQRRLWHLALYGSFLRPALARFKRLTSGAGRRGPQDLRSER